MPTTIFKNWVLPQGPQSVDSLLAGTSHHYADYVRGLRETSALSDLSVSLREAGLVTHDGDTLADQAFFSATLPRVLGLGDQLIRLEPRGVGCLFQPVPGSVEFPSARRLLGHPCDLSQISREAAELSPLGQTVLEVTYQAGAVRLMESFEMRFLAMHTLFQECGLYVYGNNESGETIVRIASLSLSDLLARHGFPNSHLRTIIYPGKARPEEIFWAHLWGGHIVSVLLVPDGSHAADKDPLDDASHDLYHKLCAEAFYPHWKQQVASHLGLSICQCVTDETLLVRCHKIIEQLGDLDEGTPPLMDLVHALLRIVPSQAETLMTHFTERIDRWFGKGQEVLIGDYGLFRRDLGSPL